MFTHSTVTNKRRDSNLRFIPFSYCHPSVQKIQVIQVQIRSTVSYQTTVTLTSLRNKLTKPPLWFVTLLCKIPTDQNHMLGVL
jgi:hypothetical protein